MDWSKYPNFTEAEFVDHESGECAMNEDFMVILQSIRTKFGKPMIINSGYRSKNHSVERIKPTPGEHTFGMAADISIHGLDALTLIKVAINNGVRRVGVNQKGDTSQRYIHLGIGDRFFEQFPPGIWSY